MMVSGTVTASSCVHPMKQLLGITERPSERETDLSAVKEKAPVPISVTLFGRTSLSTAIHPLKAYSPILVMLSGIVRPVKSKQPLKALSPMLVTPSGIRRSVKNMQLLKAWSPTLVRVEGSDTFLTRSSLSSGLQNA